MPSLSRLSPSTIVASDRSVLRRLNVATTAAGSVAETIAPTTKASSNGRPVASAQDDGDDHGRDQDAGDREHQQPAEPATELADPQPIAGLEDEARQQHDEHEVGRDLERRDPDDAGDGADAEPGDTSATVYGTRSGRATIATTAASASRPTRSSMACGRVSSSIGRSQRDGATVRARRRPSSSGSGPRSRVYRTVVTTPPASGGR